MDKMPHGHKIKDEHQGLVVSALGIIEETLEFLNAIGFKSWRPNPLPREKQLEEITDILFFYLEAIIHSDFGWPEIVKEYGRKHAINLDRYKRAKAGDYDWDDRGSREGL